MLAHQLVMSTVENSNDSFSPLLVIFGGALVAVIWLVFLIAGIRVIQKAGWSGWWILITFVPIVNIVMYLVFAFSTWPVERELVAWRASAPGQLPPSGSQPLPPQY